MTKQRIVAGVFAVAIACSFLLNQHRLQPWAWQFFLYAVITVAAKNPIEVIFSARWLTASIYFFSAISKFDYQFIFGLGGQLAQTLAETVGVEASGGMSFIAAVMPVFELLIAVLLIVGRTRKTGVVLTAIFHTALIVTLGPWGLDHHTGVLVWNGFFFLITAVLFWPTTKEKESSSVGKPSTLLFAVTLAMVLYPLLPQCDHWLAWGLYSPNNSRCELEAIQVNDKEEMILCRFDLNKMSLEQLNVPLYPEARFQLGVAQAIVQNQNMKSISRIVLKSRSNRFNGQRKSSVFEETEQWNKQEHKFLLNWRPREFK